MFPNPALLAPDQIEKIISGAAVDCKLIHGDHLCITETVYKCVKVLYYSIKVYGVVHILSLLLFRLRSLRNEPKEVLENTIKSILKSCIFAISTIACNIYGRCWAIYLTQKSTPLPLILCAMLSNFSIMWEYPSRRRELTLFILPRTIETVWNFAKKRRWMRSIPFGEVFIFTLGLSSLMYSFYVQPQHVRRSYLGLLRIVFGEH